MITTLSQAIPVYIEAEKVLNSAKELESLITSAISETLKETENVIFIKDADNIYTKNKFAIKEYNKKIEKAAKDKKEAEGIIHECLTLLDKKEIQCVHPENGGLTYRFSLVEGKVLHNHQRQKEPS